MTKPGIRRIKVLAGLGLAFLAWPALSNTSAVDQQNFLYPEERHETIGEIVTQFVQKSHYNHVAVDDELSSRVFDLFVESLDRNRMYLLEGDIEYFESLRYELDDIVKSKPMDPVFEVFQIYQTRVRERLNYALTQLEEEPDFTVDESYQFDRSEEPWVETSAELDEIWRKRVKNDALALELEEEPWEKTQEVLTKRYSGYLRRLDQVNNDDVFERFMNSFAHALDPHSSYMGPRNSEEYRIQMSLSYFGIGASLQTEDDFVKIAGIIPGGPAAADGSLKPEDRITGVGQGVEGEVVDVIGWRLDDVVVLAETKKAAESVIEAFRGLKANFIVQEFISEAGGADLRCFVVGDKVVASMIRQGREGEFRSNLHRGGSATLVKITPEERSTAVRSAKIMGLNVAGVDLLRSNHGPVVMEVNSSPGLEGIEKATKRDVAGIIIEFIEKNAKNGKTRTRGKG